MLTNTHQFTKEVCGYELDSYGHLNNANYLNYAEQVRWDILKNCHLYELFLKEGYMLVVTEAQVRYAHELKVFDQVTIHTTYRNESLYLIFDHIFRNQEGTKAAKARVKCVVLNKARKPIRLTSEILAALFPE
jgi:acyl-CoA thioester hydrolase